ncbi:hypothetical protein N7486_003854, partial [Penicillium sp. IBT 16267x]
TPPSPLSTIPFARDSDFISRDTLLHQIHEKSLVSGSRIALVGLGDIGSIRVTKPGSSKVFGISRTRSKPRALRNENKGKWLLILNNVNNDQLLYSFSVAGKEDPISSRINALIKPLLEYIPRSHNSSIIITSRTRDITLKMANYKDLIKVKLMEESEALELLQRKLN